MFKLAAWRGAATAVLLAGGAPVARAQIDYRNLDDDRPTRVTDAFPIERYAFELSLPYRIGFANGQTGHALTPRLEFGISRNVMVGLGVDLDLGGGAGEPSHGSASVLVNPLRETRSLPGIALAAEAAGTAFDKTSLTIGALATRSIGRSRVHLNLFATPLAPDPADAIEPRWWAGAAWDLTLIRSSTLLVLDLEVEEPVGGGTLQWDVGAGFRKQVAPTLVFHLGLTQGVGGPSEGTRIGLGFSHAFAVTALMRRPPR